MRCRAVLCLLLLGLVVPAEGGPPGTLRLKVDGRPVEGRPLAWSESTVALLARDGRLWQFDPRQATDVRQTTGPFRPYSATLMRSRLEREFGDRFEVISTGHYLVVHPKGNGSAWGKRFEDLFRSFQQYFSVRGFQLTQPEFPLVAVVFENEAQFAAYAAREFGAPPNGVLGYYSLETNRVAMYDVTAGADAEAWHRNVATIIHEAAHQAAFNTGIHYRFRAAPRWVVEGLGTLFEAEGVWNARHAARDSSRVNRRWLREFRAAVAAGRDAGDLAALISSDRPFRTNRRVAYAQAWALTYYLVETQPRKYREYLARTSDRPDFKSYRDAERLADFTAVFGDDLRHFDARFVRFMQSVR